MLSFASTVRDNDEPELARKLIPHWDEGKNWYHVAVIVSSQSVFLLNTVVQFEFLPDIVKSLW